MLQFYLVITKSYGIRCNMCKQKCVNFRFEFKFVKKYKLISSRYLVFCDEKYIIKLNKKYRLGGGINWDSLLY